MSTNAPTIQLEIGEDMAALLEPGETPKRFIAVRVPELEFALDASSARNLARRLDDLALEIEFYGDEW